MNGKKPLTRFHWKIFCPIIACWVTSILHLIIAIIISLLYGIKNHTFLFLFSAFFIFLIVAILTTISAKIKKFCLYIIAIVISILYDLILLYISIFILFILFGGLYKKHTTFLIVSVYFLINCIPTISLLINIKSYKHLKDTEVSEYLNDNNNNELMDDNNI